MYGQTEKEQQTIKETFERIQRENAKHDAKLNVKPLPGPLRELLRAIRAAGRQIVLADAPPIPWDVLCEGQRRELIALVRREPPQPDAPAFLQTLRERGPWLPNEADPARTLANWLARDPETGDRARVMLTDLGLSEAMALDDLPDAGGLEAATPAPPSAPIPDEAILKALRKAIGDSPQGRSTKANDILARTTGNPSVRRKHLRHLELLGEYDGFDRPTPNRYKGSKGS